MTNEEYKNAFLLGVPKGTIEKTFDLALEIRKFEIDLYWKRATYFWAFLAIALAGYFSILTSKDLDRDRRGEALLIITCLGLVFSVAWYFVNRASKFWQENWEKHVDLLEDAVVGPLYKTVLADADILFWKLWGPYQFSVSKLNQLLSLFVVGLFFLLAGTTLHRYYRISSNPDLLATSTVALTVLALITLYWKGRTSPIRRANHVHAERRETRIV